MLKIQFGAEDISNKFLEIQKLKSKTKKLTIMAAGHGLRSDLGYAYGNLGEILVDNSSHNLSPTQTLELFGPNLNLTQKAYAGNIQSKSLLIINSFENLTHICLKEEDAELKKNLDRNASDITILLNEIIQFLPLTNTLLKHGELDKYRLEFSTIADFCINNAIYVYNRKFAPNLRTEIYSFKNELRHYWAESFQKSQNNHHFELSKPGVIDIRSEEDYFENVFMPLSNNSDHYGSNPENDIYNRLKSANNLDDKSISLSSKIDKDKKIIIYEYEDNGFGIRPEIIDKIFDKGFTTNKDATTEHGIGLWAVKNFVEENGGKIWCESELGKYTRFIFTVPYDRKEVDAYVKD